MGGLRVLFIGGTGVISSACAREAAGGDHGIELFVLNRGQSAVRPLPPGVTELRADARDAASVRNAVGGLDFDCVVDFIALDTEVGSEPVHEHIQLLVHHLPG
jgi:nucleoside-diphosphate-sugar epimerase